MRAMRTLLGLLVLLGAAGRTRPRMRFAMFGHPGYGVNCDRCPKRSQFGDPVKSEFPASTRCQWCLAFLCGNHAETPFAGLAVRACSICAGRIEGASKSRDIGDGLRATFLMMPPASWAETYGSATFTGYPPNAR